MDDAGELAALLHDGRIDMVLTRELELPVHSWNDGEASAAAEALAESPGSDRPLLVLKLGTSMASGLATGEGVSALPMQLAKCRLKQLPLHEYAHPATGLSGTARDLIGAECLTRAYREELHDPQATYEDFCAAAEHGVPVARRLLCDAVAAVVELAEFVSALWSPVQLVVTGKNLEKSDYRVVFARHLRDRLNAVSARAILREARCDHDLVAAIGAIGLSLCCNSNRGGAQSRIGAGNEYRGRGAGS